MNFLLRDRKSSQKEYYKELAFNIEVEALKHPFRSLLITSCWKKEGKTTIAVNFTLACPLVKKQVLLVDANFAHPQLHEQFNLSNNLGLSQVLENPAGELGLLQAISQVEENIYLLCSGLSYPDTLVLRNEERVSEVLNSLVKDFEMVVIDGPPILSVAETVILSKVAERVILVVQKGETLKEEAQRAVSLINKDNSKLLGVVLNT